MQQYCHKHLISQLEANSNLTFKMIKNAIFKIIFMNEMMKDDQMLVKSLLDDFVLE